MQFERPYTMRPDSTGTYHVVLDNTGRIVAQGSKELADEVVAGRMSTVQRQGEFGA